MPTVEELTAQRDQLKESLRVKLEEKKGQLIQQLETKKTALEDQVKTKTLDMVGETLKEYASQVVKPIRRTAEIYNQERLSGRALVERGISTSSEQRSVWQRAKDIGLGTMQYVMSPFAGVAKGAIKEPIKEALHEGAGVPEGAAEFVGRLGEEAVYFVPIGGTISHMMLRGEPGVKAAQEVAAISKGVPKATKPTMVDATVPVPPKKHIPDIDEITSPRVRQEIVDDVTAASVDALAGNLDKSKRIFKQISERLATGEINPAGLTEILSKNQVSPEQFAKMYAETVSYGGRILGYHGRAARELQFVFKDHPEATKILQDAFKKELKEPFVIDKVFENIGKMENFRRAMLVGQVATSVRNAWSQAGRLSLSSLDEALQGALRGSVGYQGNTLEQIGEGLNNVVAATSRLTPSGRNRLTQILEENQAAISKVRLFSQPVHEVQMTDKIAHLTNTLNRTQEFYFRRVAFESKLRSLMGRNGLSFSTIDPKNIPEGMLEESVNYALEMTFAASPKSKSVQGLVNAWSKYGTLFNPFPRFHLANAVPFVYEHSPLGYLHAFRPETIKKLANGSPEEFARYASRATIGSLMLDSAMRFRQSKYAGEKWYEVKLGEEEDASVIDTRAFAPFSTYLFFAESITHPERIKPADWGQAAVGFNRISGTGLVALDWLRAKTGESFKKQVQNFAGQYIASFTTPMRTVTDVYSAFDEKENISRDYREQPMISPTILNIPKASQMVPEKPSPVKSGSVKRGETVAGIPAGLFRQMTGLTRRTKTVVEREIDKIGLEWTSVAPRTGIPEADRVMSRHMGPMVERTIGRFVKEDRYKKLPDHLKRIALGAMFQEIKNEARKKMAISNPRLAIKTRIKGLSADIEKELKER